jgi:hypothetical protein
MGVAWWIARPGTPRRDTARERQDFFATNVVQLLNEEEHRNQEAIDRARLRLASDFARYHRGVPNFADDLTSFGTRYQIAKASLADWWSDSNEARELETKQFEESVVSDQQIQRDVAAVISQFSSDLEANRNQMLSELQESVATSALPLQPVENDLGSTNLSGAFTDKLQPLLYRDGKQSIIVAGFAQAGGFIAGQAASKIVSQILGSAATDVAVEAAAGGSAVAAGAV